MAASLMAKPWECGSFMQRIKREYLYGFFVILIIICIFQYGIQKICGFTMYPDEFGYWASAAGAVGYDWTEVASLGSYYSFGYSALLTPLLKLFGDGVSVYRAAVAVNMALMCSGVLLLGSIVKILFPEMDDRIRVMAGGAAALYPAWIFYMQMTLAEALLTFLFAAAFRLFLGFAQKPGIGKGLALALVLAYMYCVHMRAIAIVIACFFTLMLLGLANPGMRRQAAAVIGAVVLAGLAVVMAKKNVILSVFSMADPETLAVNGFASQAWKIREILSPGGIWILLKEILGKVFYLGIASFGIFYWAIWWCISEAACLAGRKPGRRKSKNRTGTGGVRQWAALFLLLSAAGEILVCSIYMHGSAQVDCLIYGRYNEFLMPVVIAAGIPAMLEGRDIMKKTLAFIAATGLMIPLILSVIEAEGMEGIRGYFVVGLSPLIREENFDVHAFFRDAWIFGALLMGLTVGIIRLIKKKENRAWLIGILIAAEVILGLRASTHYTYKVNQIGFENLRIAEKILEDGWEGMRVVYLDEGAPEFIDFQQMQLMDVPVSVIEGDVETQKDRLGDFLIADSGTAQGKALGRLYDRYVRTSTFVLYYNQGGTGKDEKDQNPDVIDINGLYFWLN